MRLISTAAEASMRLFDASIAYANAIYMYIHIYIPRCAWYQRQRKRVCDCLMQVSHTPMLYICIYIYLYPDALDINGSGSEYASNARIKQSWPIVHTKNHSQPLLHTSAYVSIRQHTSAYVSIRQHTSAYRDLCTRRFTVSPSYICQHTSALVYAALSY